MNLLTFLTVYSLFEVKNCFPRAQSEELLFSTIQSSDEYYDENSDCIIPEGQTWILDANMDVS